MLFLAPSGIASLIAARSARNKTIEWAQIQSWQKVTATIESAGVLRNGGKKPNRQQTGRVTGPYSNAFEGGRDISQAVSLFGLSNNIGSFKEDNLKYQQRTLKQQHATHWDVNPSSPPDAIPRPHPRRELFTFVTVIAMRIGLLGPIDLARNRREAVVADVALEPSSETPRALLPRWAKEPIRSIQREYLEFRKWWLVWIMIRVLPAVGFSLYGVGRVKLITVIDCASGMAVPRSPAIQERVHCSPQIEDNQTC